MKEISTCQVINTADKKQMTVITEWMNDEVKIVLLRSGTVPFIGETTITKLSESAKSEKTREEFSQDVRNELSGKDKDVQFSFLEPRFSWKKKVWRKGTVEMQPIEDSATLASMNIEWLSNYSTSQETMFRLQKDNEILKMNSDELTDKINELGRLKKSMEEILYKRFICLLNSKKRRIRELEEKLSSPEVFKKPSVFDENTDDSDVDEEKVFTPRKRQKPEEEPANSNASTSKKALKTPINFTPDSDEIDERDDEIVLRYDESQAQNSKLNTEEEPEDDLFSQ